MARVSYDILPIEGARQERDIPRVVNQAMSGKQNCVGDFSFTSPDDLAFPFQA